MKKVLIALFCCFLLLTSACSDNGKRAEDANTTKSDALPAVNKVRVASTEVSYGVMESADAWYKEKGVDLDLIMTVGNVNILRAVESGDTDAGVGVHLKFMEAFNQKDNGHLVMVKPYPYTTGIGLYSEKHSRLEEIENGAQIAIMNDPMNMHRGLIIMENAGFIVLDPNKKDSYSLLDIIENPKGITFIEMDQAQTVRVLPELDASLVFFTHMRNAGKDFRSFLVRDKDADEYPMGLVVRADKVQEAWVPIVAEGLLSPAARNFIHEKYDDVFEYYK